jgi:hypothetical protein
MARTRAGDEESEVNIKIFLSNDQHLYRNIEEAGL